jgi:serralysin
VDVTAGSEGAWTPIGAVQTASGYDVAWKVTGTNEYTIWSTDSNGNYVSNLIGGVSATSAALEAFEPIFDQNLNGTGDLTTTVIQTDNSTSLTEVGNAVSSVYYLDNSGGSGPALKYEGVDVTAGGEGAWTPIGAVQTASGYDVAWKLTGTNEYTIWSTDSNGNYVSNLIGGVPGNSTALESFEAIFNQDLNGDGVMGIYAAPGATLTAADPCQVYRERRRLGRERR